MDELRFSPDLLASGYTHTEVRRMTRMGELVRVRRGAYAVTPAGSDSASSDPVLAHLRLVAATLPQLAPEAVVSHMSAAVLHGLPIWRSELTGCTPPGIGPAGKVRPGSHLHASPLPPEDITMVDGHPVTTVARTVIDLGRSLPMERSVGIGDAALRVGLEGAALHDVLGRCAGWRGVAAARRMVDFLDARSESMGESYSRVLFRQLGLPAPTPQFEVRDERGRLVGRSDFCWEEHRTLGEFDGLVKYGRLLKEGQTVADVLFDEKRREDEMRDLNWQMVRWTWGDLMHPADLPPRIQRAFARNRR